MAETYTGTDVEFRANAVDDGFEGVDVQQHYEGHPKWGSFIEVHAEDTPSELLEYMNSKGYYVAELGESSRGEEVVTFKPRE